MTGAETALISIVICYILPLVFFVTRNRTTEQLGVLALYIFGIGPITGIICLGLIIEILFNSP